MHKIKNSQKVIFLNIFIELSTASIGEKFEEKIIEESCLAKRDNFKKREKSSLEINWSYIAVDFEFISF